jgi:hypothetical protein
MPISLEVLLDQKQLALILGVTEKTLEAWRCRGGGPPSSAWGALYGTVGPISMNLSSTTAEHRQVTRDKQGSLQLRQLCW